MARLMSTVFGQEETCPESSSPEAAPHSCVFGLVLNSLPVLEVCRYGPPHGYSIAQEARTSAVWFVMILVVSNEYPPSQRQTPANMRKAKLASMSYSTYPASQNTWLTDCCRWESSGSGESGSSC